MTEGRGYKSDCSREILQRKVRTMSFYFVLHTICNMFFVCLGLKSGWKKYLSSVSGNLANLSAVTRNFSAGEMSRVWVNDLYCFIQIPMGVLEGKNDCRIWSS